MEKERNDRTRVAVPISHKIHKGGLYIKIMGSIQQEDLTTKNMHPM